MWTHFDLCLMLGHLNILGWNIKGLPTFYTEHGLIIQAMVTLLALIDFMDFHVIWIA